MNQALSLNIDNTATNKPSESSQGLKGLSNGNGDDSKGFSAELDKHIDKSSKSESDAVTPNKGSKEPQDEESLTKNKRQAADETTENGKILPVDESVNEIEVLAELDSDAIDELELLDASIIVATTINKDTIPNDGGAKPDFVSKESGKEFKSNKTSVLVDTALKNEVKREEASSVKPAEAIRPDILRALSGRVVSNDSPKSETLKPVSFIESVVGDKQLKVQSGVIESGLQIKAETAVLDGELQIKPETLMQAKMIDKGLASSFTNLSPSTALGGQLTNTAPSSLARTEVPILDIQPEVQSKAWGKVLSSRVVWMAQEGVQQAALRLNPGSLGSIEVKLSMQSEQVNISFVTQNTATRDALEQALPKLRESLDEKGLELTGADVSQQESFDNAEEEVAEGGSSVVGDSIASNDDVDELEQMISESDKEQGLSLYA